MSITLTTRPATSGVRHVLTPANLINSELIKALAIPSTIWCAVITAGLSLFITVGVFSSDGLGLDPHPMGNVGQPAAMAAMIVPLIAGCLLSSVEYTSGAIRPTLAAAQRRLTWLTAKASAAVIIQAATQLITIALSLIAGLIICLARGLDTSVTGADAGYLARAAAMGVLMELIGFALGMITRSAAAGVALSIAVIWILPTVMQVLTSFFPWLIHISQALPSLAAQNMVGGDPASGWWTTCPGGAVVLLVWTAVLLVGSGALLKHRDA
jgi:ABC-2 type transport system permease protein